jgi:hypothetical protein
MARATSGWAKTLGRVSLGGRPGHAVAAAVPRRAWRDAGSAPAVGAQSAFPERGTTFEKLWSQSQEAPAARPGRL